MFPAFSASSSPPSSPCSLLDSSPPSSPSHASDTILVENEVLELPSYGLSHPFAASVKANRRPPQYEKKRSPPPMTPSLEIPAKKSRYYEPEKYLGPVSPVSSTLQTDADPEAAIWDEASTKAFDRGHGAVFLDNHNLTHIPLNFISDMANFFIPPEKVERSNTTLSLPGERPFTRTVTEPAGDGASGARLFSRTRSVAMPCFGLPREELQLFLSSNKIRSLPVELMNVQNLCVLSLRNNLITHIPPEIANLNHLHTLNIANNRIEYLPSEMLHMSLSQLSLYPNPFKQSPESPHSSIGSQSSLWARSTPRRILSVVEHCLPRITPLSELALRVLFTSTDEGVTNLRAYYAFPLDGIPEANTVIPPRGKRQFFNSIPPHIQKILHACDPKSMLFCDEEAADPMIAVGMSGVGTCPSARHHQKTVLVQHAEQRFSWEHTIAGVRVGGLIPVRWRGCQWGCLDFLDDGDQLSDKLEDWEPTPTEDTGSMELDSDTPNHDIVQVMHLDSSIAEDFND